MSRVRRSATVVVTAAVLSLSFSCQPRPRVLAPAEGSSAPLDGTVPVQIEFGTAPASFRVTLLRGIDAPPASPVVLTDRFTLQGTQATGALTADDLAPGRNALFVAVDGDGDGQSDNAMSSTFRWDPLRAASCVRSITPVAGVNHTDPVYMAGFGNDRQATGVHDDVWARGFVLQNAERKLALVTLDVVGYFYNEVQTIRALAAQAGFAADAIMVTSTHNHEGPDTMGLWGPDETTSGVDLGYLDFVNQQVVECLLEADAQLAPAEIRFATGTTAGASLPPHPDLVADGKVLESLTIPGSLLNPPQPTDLHVQGDPGEITNPSLPALQIRHRVTRETIATVVNFASHPESLGSANTLITSDFPHWVRSNLERRYGGTAIFVSADLGVLQGPLDVDVIDPATGAPAPRRTFRFAQVMGQLLEGRAASALDAVDEWHANPALDVRSDGPIKVYVENPFFVILGAVGVFGRRLPEVDPIGSFVETEVNALRIGPAQLAVTPNELDPQIGDLYRARMAGAEHRWIVGLGNDEIGYQMPVEKFNPACHLCAIYIISGNEENCPVRLELGEAAVDCGTVFSNNVGGRADPLLQGAIRDVLDELNEQGE